MNYTKTAVLFALLTFAFLSCEKEGCTDSDATNYNEKAKKDDGSCEYVPSKTVDTYTVQDSTKGPFQNVTYENYSIQIATVPTDTSARIIVNYGNLTNNLTGLPLEVLCQKVGDSIFIHQQLIEGDNITGNSFDDFEISATKGYFQNDSIFFELKHFINGGDIYVGDCWGKK